MRLLGPGTSRFFFCAVFLPQVWFESGPSFFFVPPPPPSCATGAGLRRAVTTSSNRFASSHQSKQVCRVFSGAQFCMLSALSESKLAWSSWFFNWIFEFFFLHVAWVEIGVESVAEEKWWRTVAVVGTGRYSSLDPWWSYLQGSESRCSFCDLDLLEYSCTGAVLRAFELWLHTYYGYEDLGELIWYADGFPGASNPKTEDLVA
jgi:hypothetical protein